MQLSVFRHAYPMEFIRLSVIMLQGVPDCTDVINAIKK